ncbi:MAG: hypothetical protein PV345_02180 [Wolbachia sp.]|nr:hypothetical protein [Wolbachia sp.]
MIQIHDKYKPVVTISQSHPLIIANVTNGNLIKKDHTKTKKTFEECKKFFNKNCRITDCTGKGVEYDICKESI